MSRYPGSSKGFAEECKHCIVELLWPLQWCEVTHTRKVDKFCIGNILSEIFSVFALDEFIMLTMNDHDGHANLSQIVRRIIGLRSLHEANRIGKLIELIWRGR